VDESCPIQRRSARRVAEEGRLTTEDGRLSRWYAVYCQPHRESAAAAHLKNQDFAVFLPKREKVVRHARKIEKVRRPFFPGYLFVDLDIDHERWRSINSTVGVIRIVTQNDRPTPAPMGVIESIKAACGDDDILRFHPDLSVGQKVRVIGGPFADFVGELDQLTDSERVRVLLDIMGGRTRVVLPRDYLTPADS
jgi:transcription elongation factor/antiterminator RfaH